MTPIELARALADAARRSGQRGAWDAFVAGVRALDKPPVETKSLSSPNLVCSGNADQN